MPCAAERHPGRGRAVRWAAVLAAACLLAACTGTPRSTGHHGRPSLLPLGRRGFARHVIIFSGGGALGSAPVIFLGAGGGGSRPRITVPPIPPANSSLTIAMPLEAYQAISTQEQETLADASNLLVQRCMAARGFEDTSSAAAPLSSVGTLQQVEAAGAGLTSITQARTFGFVRPKGPGAAAPSGPQIIGYVSAVGFGQSLKAGRAYAEALFGFGPGTGAGPGGHLGCLQQASKAVYGALFGEPVPDPVPQIAAQAASFTQTDPRIRAVIRAWSACMARHYYHYSSPSQLEGHNWRSPPNRAEIATAVADVACKARTNLLNTWLAVEAAYQQALIGQNLVTLSQLQANFAPLLRRANAALAAAG
jgi:hypothetical protein